MTAIAYSSFRKSVLEELLLREFGIHPNAILYLKRGFNDTYRVETNHGPFILRVYRAERRKLEDIRAELKLLLFLQKNNIPVSVPISGKGDVFVHRLDAPEGARHAVLFSFAEGESLRKPSIRQCQQTGEALAGIHSSGLEFDPGPMCWNYEPSAVLQMAVQSVAPLLSNTSPESRYLEAFVEFSMNQTSKLRTVSGICHGDLQAENFYFSQAGKVTFIDFDFAGRGPLLYDLGAYTWYDHQGKTKEMIKAFYDGYSSIRYLSAEERSLIPLFGALRAIFLMGMWMNFMDGESNPIWPAAHVKTFIAKHRKWVGENCGVNL